HEGIWLSAGFGGNVDDSAPFLLLHPRQRSATGSNSGKNIQLENCQPFIVAQIFECAKTADSARVVDKDMDRPKLLHRLVDEPVYVIRLVDVGDDAENVSLRALHSGGGFFELDLAAGADHHLAAFSRERRRDRIPDSLA